MAGYDISVSRLDVRVRDFNERPLEGEYPFVMVDVLFIPKRIRFAKRFRKKCVWVMGLSPRHHKHLRKPEAKGYISLPSHKRQKTTD